MKVKFVPQNIELEIQPNQSVMDLAHKNGNFIRSICNGVPSCSECRVKIVEGESNVMPPGAKELALIGTGYFIDQRRLSCQLKCYGDITVDMTEQLEKQKAVPKKILGNKKLDQVTSHAVTGNLIDQEQELLVQAQRQQPSSNRPDKEEVGSRNQGGRDQRDQKRGGSNKNRHTQRR